MKNTFGQSICVTLFGESHGQEIGAVLDGIAPGIEINQEFIANQLTLRRPAGSISTPRSENDKFRMISGVYNGKTTGTPLCLIIPNSDVKNEDYDQKLITPRPGHADYSGECKYHGFEDIRGGGHFSGRLTAPLVAVGAIIISALERKGIKIGTHISSVGEIRDREFDPSALDNEIKLLNSRTFAVLDESIGQKMQDKIKKAGADGDSIGGVLETVITGIPAGVGEPWFDTLEGVISHGLFAIPAIKGVEFGDGFKLALMRGSQANDCFAYEDGKIVTKTNHNGGINGGISNGMPIVFRCAVKPTPTISLEQETVDMAAGSNRSVEFKGRHDPAIVHRARVVVDSMAAIALADMLALRFGTDWLGDVK